MVRIFFLSFYALYIFIERIQDGCKRGTCQASRKDLVIPALQGISPDALSAMVQEVNQTVLSPGSFLSDHVYYCHKETGEVEIC